MKIALSPCHLVTLSRGPRRGSAFIITLWIIAALSGLVLVLGQSVRIEALASANRLALVQADAAEKGAEQYALSAVDTEVATPGFLALNNVFTSDPLIIGDPAAPSAYVWFVKPDQFDETAISFGLIDEASKIDLNHAAASPTTMNDMFLNLPNVTQENVDCILDWENPAATQRPEGAEDSYYMSCNPPYHCKNAPFETVEELNLVKSIVTDDSGNPTDLLYGQDYTRSGHVDPSTNFFAPTLSLGQSTSNRGLFPFITVYGVKASTTPPATSSSSSGGGASTTANVNNPNANFQKVLANALGGGRATQIMRTMDTLNPPLRIPVGRGATFNFASTLQWAAAVGLTSAEFSKVIHLVTATSATGGGGGGASAVAKINVNTATEQVLMCLPGFTQTDADAILAYLQANPNPTDPTDISWLLDTISPRIKLAAAATYLTGASYCFSVDILAVSPDGRAFKRMRVVIDASSGTSQIIYRRDLSSYGWPIDPQIRDDLRHGKPPTPSAPSTPLPGGHL